MRINTNSWHYKLNSRIFNDVPNYLCPYLRHLVFSVLLGWTTIVSRFLQRFSITFPDLGIGRWCERQKLFRNKHFMVGMYGSLVSGLYLLDFMNTSFLIGMFIALGLIATSKYWLHSFVSYLVKTKVGKYLGEHGNDEVKMPNLVTEYVKSNHNKICPKLDFIDTKIVKFNEEIAQIKEPEPPEKLKIKNKPDQKIIQTDKEVK